MVVKSDAYLQGRFGTKFFNNINNQITEMGEKGWDYYKTIGLNGLVFRKPRNNDE